MQQTISPHCFRFFSFFFEFDYFGMAFPNQNNAQPTCLTWKMIFIFMHKISWFLVFVDAGCWCCCCWLFLLRKIKKQTATEIYFNASFFFASFSFESINGSFAILLKPTNIYKKNSTHIKAEHIRDTQC